MDGAKAPYPYLPFAVDADGTLFVSSALDYEREPTRYQFSVTASSDRLTDQQSFQGIHCEESRLNITAVVTNENVLENAGN